MIHIHPHIRGGLRTNQPSCVHGHSGFGARVPAIRRGEPRSMINESDPNTVLSPLSLGLRAFGSPGARLEAHEYAKTVVGTAVSSRESCGRVERRARLAGR